MFKPEYAVLATIGVALLLGILLINGLGVKSGAAAASLPDPGGSSAVSAAASGAGAAVPVQAPLAKATLDLVQLAKANNIDEADNVRWTLVRDFTGGKALYSDASGVNWKELRKVTQAGMILVPAGSSWSFNQAYQEGVGYKNASGVLAGGQCALATVLRVAADRAGLETEAKQHRYPIPGFALSETANIWWGRDDLMIHNPTATSLSLAWILTPQAVTVSVIPAQGTASP